MTNCKFCGEKLGWWEGLFSDGCNTCYNIYFSIKNKQWEKEWKKEKIRKEKSVKNILTAHPQGGKEND